MEKQTFSHPLSQLWYCGTTLEQTHNRIGSVFQSADHHLVFVCRKSKHRSIRIELVSYLKYFFVYNKVI